MVPLALVFLFKITFLFNGLLWCHMIFSLSSFLLVPFFLDSLDLHINRILCVYMCLEVEGNRWVHTHGMLGNEAEMKETREQWIKTVSRNNLPHPVHSEREGAWDQETVCGKILGRCGYWVLGTGACECDLHFRHSQFKGWSMSCWGWLTLEAVSYLSP